MQSWTLNKWLGLSFLLIGMIVIAVLVIKEQVILGLIFSIMPLLIISLVFILNNPYWGMIILFVNNYFLMGFSRYLTIPAIGVLTDALIFFIFFSLILRSIQHKDVEWRRALNSGTIVFFIWTIYCFFELANPTAVTEAWMASIRSLTLYPIAVIILTSIILRKPKDIVTILNLWAAFTILAFIKTIIQKNFGFDSAENRWLSNPDNASTHLISTGTRYFSFFTDASNLGSNMGLAMVIFLISSIYTKIRLTRIFYILAGLLGMIAMFLSGTRGAIAVPIAGFFFYTLLSKNTKIIVSSITLIVFVLFFFMFTTIGHNNQYIRRMRSAFNPDDPSLLVRLENQKRLSDYLRTKPFGEGVGLSGGAARRFDPNRITTNIPNDSWYVKVWVETGVTGVTLFLAIQLFFIFYGAYLVIFKLKNRELKGYITAMISGVFGIMVSAYGNAFYGQYPTLILTSLMQGFIVLSPLYDKELEAINKKNNEYGYIKS